MIRCRSGLIGVVGSGSGFSRVVRDGLVFRFLSWFEVVRGGSEWFVRVQDGSK